MEICENGIRGIKNIRQSDKPHGFTVAFILMAGMNRSYIISVATDSPVGDEGHRRVHLRIHIPRIMYWHTCFIAMEQVFHAVETRVSCRRNICVKSADTRHLIV